MDVDGKKLLEEALNAAYKAGQADAGDFTYIPEDFPNVDEVWEAIGAPSQDFKKVLQEKITEFLTTLPKDEDHEWWCTDHEVGKTVLRAFFWSAAPELKPKELPSWEEWPLPKGLGQPLPCDMEGDKWTH